MTERPILFSAPMVRAILDGTKTQTRRIAKGVATIHSRTGEPLAKLDSAGPRVACPYGQIGDRLWVRETWAYGVHALASRNHEQEGPWVYAADNAGAHGRLCDRWRPSIHMFRAASRITLEITGVRVERLQDISEDDARAEGITDGGCLNCGNSETDCGCLNPRPDAVDSYCHLWGQINGAGSWEANPWVWVVEFRRVEAP